ADENGMLLFTLIKTHDGLGDLAHQIAAVVRRFQIEFQCQLAEQIERGSGSPVQIQDLVQVGIERGGEATGGGRFTGADFPGEQAGAVMIGQKLQPCLGLIPGLRREQLFGIGAIAERRFLKAEKSFHHDGYSFSCFCLSSSTKLMPVGSGSAEAVRFTEGNWPLTTGSTGRAVVSSCP